MLVKIGRLSFYDGRKDVFIKLKGDGKSCKGCDVVLTERDIDIRWLDEICRYIEKSKTGKLSYDNIDDRKYILLYLIFSTRRRIFLEDIIDIGEWDELYTIKNEGFDFQSYYWNKLNQFMMEKGYKYKMLKANMNLYCGEIRIPYKTYNWNEKCSIAEVALFITRIRGYLVGRWGYGLSCIGKTVSRKKVRNYLKNDYVEVKDLNFPSQSGCLLFQGTKSNGEKRFIKYGGLLGADIKDEYLAVKWLVKNTKKASYYLLPRYVDSRGNKIEYDYEQRQIRLKEIVKTRSLYNEEFDKLLDFLIAVLEDIKKYHVVHRDIHPDNILVQLDEEGKIISYRLIDFGCACIHEVLRKENWRDRRKNKYAGSMFRYSVNGWNDAASALFLVLELSNIEFERYRSKLQKIKAIMDENYTIMNT